MHKKQVEADTIREFVEGRKVWAVKEKEASEEENRQIIKFIEKKDAWRREQEAIAKDRRYIQCFSVLYTFWQFKRFLSNIFVDFLFLLILYPTYSLF